MNIHIEITIVETLSQKAKSVKQRIIGLLIILRD